MLIVQRYRRSPLSGKWRHKGAYNWWVFSGDGWTRKWSIRTNMLSLYTVDSLFIGYKFSWISWVQVNHEFKCSMNSKFSIGLCADFGRTTNLNVHESVCFVQSTKIGTHENKWIHSIPFGVSLIHMTWLCTKTALYCDIAKHFCILFIHFYYCALCIYLLMFLWYINDVAPSIVFFNGKCMYSCL